MKKIFGISVIFTMILINTHVLGQEGGRVSEEGVEGKHSLALVLMHSRIGQGRNEAGMKQFTTVPAFALDYNYWFAENFAIGLHTDFLNENFIVESESGGELIERERPIAPVIMATYSAGEHFNFSLGFGGEFAEGDDYFVTRFAVEYGVEIRNGWAMLASISQDFRANVYNVTSVGLGVEKRFGR